MNPVCPLCRGQAKLGQQMRDSFYGVTDHCAQLAVCADCQLMFHHPMPSRERVADFYPDGYWQEQDETSLGLLQRLQRFYINGMLRFDLMRWVQRLAPEPGSKWLDIGCSRGDWAALIAERGLQVSGVEADPRAAAYAREHYGLDVIQADDGSWNPEPESFESISFFHLLEHVLDPIAFLEKVHRALKPGGQILLRVPNRSSWQARWLGERWKGWEQPRHLTMWNPTCLKAALAKTGFEVRHTSTWSLRDGPPCLASSLYPAGEPTWQQIHQKPSALKTVLYLGLTWALAPIEIIAAGCGAGSMITLIAIKS